MVYLLEMGSRAISKTELYSREFRVDNSLTTRRLNIWTVSFLRIHCTYLATCADQFTVTLGSLFTDVFMHY
jgi:hypothetical protein